MVDRIYETDVLVVGGGAAALRAAIASADHGARVMVVLKGKIGKSGATVSPDSPGVAWQVADGCSGENDSPEVHYRNILDVGLGMADPRLARILAFEVVDRTAEMEEWGVEFVPDLKGKKPHFTAHSCFADQPRAHYIKDSGRGHAGDIVHAMVTHARKRKIELHQAVMITDLLVENGTCVGALGLADDGMKILYRSGAVVFGSGGARQIFPAAVQKRIDTTGDGYAMALRAGARLTNMEFIQYMTFPRGFGLFDIPGMFWGMFPKLRNLHGEEVLNRYLPPGVTAEQAMADRCFHMPFSVRDASGWIEVAIVSETRAGRGAPEGGLYLDFTGVDVENYKPLVQHHFEENPGREPVIPGNNARVMAEAHASNGGILIDPQASSSLPGLYAAGEACAGPHGADRLGGGMVSMGIVFGARAGWYAAEFALGHGRSEPGRSTIAQALRKLDMGSREKRDPEELIGNLQKSMGRDFLNVKNGPALGKLLGRIEELSQGWLPELRRDKPAILKRSLEAENLLKVSELMVRAALERKESRGNHFREDYPELDEENWRKNVIFQDEGGNLHIVIESIEK